MAPSSYDNNYIRLLIRLTLLCGNWIVVVPLLEHSRLITCCLFLWQR